ncbi:MAG: alpha/beta fold hydrolase [Candidatus Heimdallarchaeota archaeon]|nr:alpha/beta fold hydrolase [Candidatus Heimdallarchaeota archaeon]
MIYIESTSIFPSYVKEPANYNPEIKYPIIIGLHGGGGTPKSIIKLWDEIEQTNFIYIAPQAPFPLSTDDCIGFDWLNWPSGDDQLVKKSFVLSENYIVDVIRNISEIYNSGEIYLAGWSQGAIMAYLVGIKHSDLIKGVISMSGPGLLSPLINPFGRPSSSNWLSENDIESASELRVFISHGKNDGHAKIELATQSAKILNKYKHETNLRIFDGGHELPPKEVLEEINSWL